jgi:hypothetical protein
MRIFAAKMKQGALVPEGAEDLPDGATVTVIADDGEERFTATPEEEEALLQALADETGTLTAAELLSRLR